MSKTRKVASTGAAFIACALILLGVAFVSDLVQANPASAWERPRIEVTGGACVGGVRATPVTIKLTNLENGFHSDPLRIENVVLVGDPPSTAIPLTVTFSPNPVPNTGSATSTASFDLDPNYVGTVKGELDAVWNGDTRYRNQGFSIVVSKCVEPTTTTTEPPTTTTTVVTTTSTTQPTTTTTAPTTTSTTQPTTTTTAPSTTTSTTQPTTTTTRPTTTSTTQVTTTTTEPETTTTTEPETTTTTRPETTTTTRVTTTVQESSTTTAPEQTTTTVCDDTPTPEETTPSGEPCAPAPGAPAPPSTSNGPLPVTGGAQSTLVFIAGVLFVVGLATLLAARRIAAS